MGYELEHRETLDEAARRVAMEQVGTALAWLEVATGDDPGAGRTAAATNGATIDQHGDVRPSVATDLDHDVDSDASVEEAVHEARKCCKRIRGLVRLVRPAMEDAYRSANAAARDAARHLSTIRDAHALLATFDDLVAAHADQVPQGGLTGVRETLDRRSVEATERITSDLGRITAAHELLRAVQADVPDWPLNELGHAEALQAMAAGIAKTAGRAAARFHDVVDADGQPSDELLHEWRKRAKYSWYHFTLVEPAAVSLVGVQADALHDLAATLGDDHDLAVLSSSLRADPLAFGHDHQVDGALVLIDRTRRDLQRRAVSQGARLHAEDPRAMGVRLAAFVAAWHRHGPELRAGDIADLHGSDEALADRSGPELRELARQLDLPGRSRMDRGELLAVLRAAGAG